MIWSGRLVSEYVRQWQEMAERQGFEPWIPCGIHAFQACAIGHSAISPATSMLPRGVSTRSSNGVPARKPLRPSLPRGVLACAAPSTGVSSRIESTVVIMPPTTTRASGCCACAPMPLLIAAGNSPRPADMQAIRTGRISSSEPSRKTCLPCRAMLLRPSYA